MAEVDSKLAASLKQSKINPMSFVFVAKGNEGKLILDKKKISNKVADDAKKNCGGGHIVRGRCKHMRRGTSPTPKPPGSARSAMTSRTSWRASPSSTGRCR